MEKTYERINWENYPSVVTPINEKNLNKMDSALDEVDNRVIGLDTAKLDKSIANTMVKDVSFDENTGIFTITYLNGTVKKVDTALEKIATNFTYNRDTQKLLLTLVDGTEQVVDLSSLISQYEFTDSDYITFEVGNDGKVKATIKAGSITEEMLQPNFLADVKVEVEKAKTYSNSASNSSNEAKQYRDEAEQFRNEASLFVPEGYDELVQTVEENTVKIDTLLEKAGLEFNNTTKGSNIHLTDSADSNVVALELYGKTEQNAYTGKNLLDCSGLTETTTNGVTFTPVYDANGSLECINVNGTASANAIFELKTEPIDKTNTYIFNGCPSGGSTSSYRMTYTEWDASWNWLTTSVDTGEGILLTHNDSVGNASFRIEIASGTTVSNLKFYPMISADGGEYEPYVGGMPSPSPSYPQEIKSVKGKNLLDCRGLVETTTNGVKFTPVYDENGNLLYVNVNGTASANTNYVLCKTPKLSSGKLIMSGCPSGGSTDNYFLQYSSNISVAYSDIGNGVEVSEMDYNTYPDAEVKIQVRSGYTANNIKFYPMIRSASIKDNTYVPYGLLKIKTHNANLVDMSNPISITNMSYNDDTKTYVQTSADTRNDFLLYIRQLKAYNDTSDYKWIYDKGILNAQMVACTFTKLSGYNCLSIKHNGQAKDVGIFLDISNLKDGVTYYFKMNIVNATQGSIEFGEIIISETESDYIPYQSTEITLSEPIELNGFNGVYDVITSEGVTRRFGVVVLDGTESYRMYNKCIACNVIDTLVKPADSNYTIPRILCEKFIPDTPSNVLNGVNVNTITVAVVKDTFRLRFHSDIFSSVEDAISYFSTNPTSIVYELATPTKEELQSDFTGLKTFYPETHVSNDADCDMSITYTADAKNYIDNKIALLTTAIYNNI